jgi:hypothetical protein
MAGIVLWAAEKINHKGQLKTTKDTKEHKDVDSWKSATPPSGFVIGVF